MFTVSDTTTTFQPQCDSRSQLNCCLLKTPYKDVNKAHQTTQLDVGKTWVIFKRLSHFWTQASNAEVAFLRSKPVDVHC